MVWYMQKHPVYVRVEVPNASLARLKGLLGPHYHCTALVEVSIS